MSSHYYGISRPKIFTVEGQGEIDVATTSTTADPIELRVDDLTASSTVQNWSRAELYAACEKLADYLANFYGVFGEQ